MRTKAARIIVETSQGMFLITKEDHREMIQVRRPNKKLERQIWG
jgi:hypothetical protein